MWTAILASLITGSAAVAGVALTQRRHSKTVSEQLMHATEEANRAVRRDAYARWLTGTDGWSVAIEQMYASSVLLGDGPVNVLIRGGSEEETKVADQCFSRISEPRRQAVAAKHIVDVVSGANVRQSIGDAHAAIQNWQLHIGKAEYPEAGAEEAKYKDLRKAAIELMREDVGIGE